MTERQPRLTLDEFADLRQRAMAGDPSALSELYEKRDDVDFLLGQLCDFNPKVMQANIQSWDNDEMRKQLRELIQSMELTEGLQPNIQMSFILILKDVIRRLP